MSTHNNDFKLAANCKNQVLAAYQYKIKVHTKLLAIVKKALIETLAEHVNYCVLSGKNLLLYTEEGEWIAHLNTYQAVILTAIADKGFTEVEKIQVRLMSKPKESSVTRNANVPSKRNIELMRDSLQGINDDKLKQALLRLNKTLDRLS